MADTNNETSASTAIKFRGIIRQQARRFMRWSLPHDSYMESIWDGRSWWSK